MQFWILVFAKISLLYNTVKWKLLWLESQIQVQCDVSVSGGS